MIRRGSGQIKVGLWGNNGPRQDRMYEDEKDRNETEMTGKCGM